LGKKSELSEPLDTYTLSQIHSAMQAMARQREWKDGLDTLLASLREEFVYDNVTIYMQDEAADGLDVLYARAVGRGKHAEADVSWGEGIAGQVLAREEIILQKPHVEPDASRLGLPFLVGLPLQIGGRVRGAEVFVRFGGPAYSQEHIRLASLISLWSASILERKALQEARAELDSVQAQMRLQDDFVSTISHELRTPLGFIKGYSTSLLRQDTTWDPKTEREFLTIIDEETDRLTGLIENMLESARLQSRTMQFKFQPLRLEALVRDIAMRVKVHKPELQVEITLDPIPPILGDSMRLSQVFENLFGNAIKYAPGSPLAIRLYRADRKVRVEFSDRGPGIPETFIPFVFERFYRVPGQSITGTGLGLYICKQIILAHHGKIWAESGLDQGTTFFIELPVDSAS
jgi:signal transduction histidine kinase